LRTETSSSQKFADSILAVRPRVAVFDCDGTLWSGDSGADFFYWQIDRGMFPHGVAERAAARYADYKQGKVDEEVMCGEMVTINAGNSVQTLLAASVHIDDGQITDRLIRVPSGPGKATAIAEVVQKQVDVCFGNSIHDAAMLEVARHAFAVNPNPDLEKIAQEKSWQIYWPAGTHKH
jgi:phosphoserine phosphatase